MTKTKHNVELHLEAHPKAVKRALRAAPNPGSLAHGFADAAVRASDKEAGENGGSVLTYTHTHDETTHAALQRALVHQANREWRGIIADDEEDA